MSVTAPRFPMKPKPTTAKSSATAPTVPSHGPAIPHQETAMNVHDTSIRMAQGASAPRLNNVSDHLSEALHIMEAVWMAAADISQDSESEAIRTVIHLAQRLVEGARDDVDAYRASQAVSS